MTWTQQAMPAVNPGGVYLGQVAYAPTTQCGYIIYGLTHPATATRGTWRLCLANAGGNQPPVASFTATPSSVNVGSPTALSAAASSDPDGSITSYAWNFGDGTTGSGVSTSKSYTAPGTYTITLTVTDNAGATGGTTRTVAVTASNQPPVASVSAHPSPAGTGVPITFSAAGSFDPDGSIASYAWNFGDGTTGSGASTSKSYSTAGTYTVTLTVTDNGGASATATVTVTVTGTGGNGTIWMEDALPPGAGVGGNESFVWVTSSPTPYSGGKAHQSALASGIHQHYFSGANPKFPVGVGDRLFTYVYLDPANPPKQVMLQWYDGSWEHRAYWGTPLIPWGGRNMGALPPAGQWVRLEVPAAFVGLEGRMVSGVAFTLYDGRATWDYTGVVSGGSNQPPVASFTATPPSVTVGSPTALSAAASSDPDGSITSYAWNFGDGTTGSGVSTSKSYTAPGTYTIALTVTDNAGATGTTTRTVTVTASNQPPVANVSANPPAAETGVPIAFSAAGSFDPDGSIASYAWNFGDGTTGSGASMSKSYSTAGTYTVALTVTDDGGATATDSVTVTVSAAGEGTTVIWMDDALPPRAGAGGNEPFVWVISSPAPFSGSRAHQSALASGIHQHYFTGANPKFPVAAGDRLFTYVYLDPANPPRQVMLQFYDGSWEHRAYWGTPLIPWGGRNMGSLPPAGQWVRLEVPAAFVGLEGRMVSGVAFTLYDGRATWDRTGIVKP
jgi:PKD repeat protein